MENSALKTIKNLITYLFAALLIVYILIGILFFFFQGSFIYYPNSENFESCPGFKYYEKVNFKGTRFYFLNRSSEIIVYYHGNYGSTCDRSLIKSTFEKTNKSLIFVEYAGYSNDKVKPSKKLLLNDVENIILYLESNNFNKITIYGQSIGSGPASYHVSLGNVERLILVNPFARLTDLIQSKIKVYPEFIFFILK